MAPIRDWTGAITISPLPYCEIAAGGFGVGIATTDPPRLSTPALEVGSFSTCGRALCVGVFLNERVVDNGKNSLCDMVVEWEKVCNFAVSIWCCAY